ncbi:MAG TPA: PHB depolymerase family esterase [Chitinispirillaceae bacterium]|nr:PHB depolymerase family esterase [Chitinispirillaceae bacterium]
MINRSILVVVFVFTISASLSAQTKTMNIAGVNRTYIVHAPSGINNPPLLLNIHGYNMDGPTQQSYTEMDKVADREKFIVVYPSAINKSWDMSGTNDFTFLMAIIDTVDKQYKIDRKRIYSCGFSQGGFMTFNLACRYSDVFAAIAPTSGNMSGNCTLKRPMSMRLTFGTNEGFSGGTAAFMQNVTKWLDMCNCPKTPVVTRPYPSTNPNSVVTRLYYGPCDGGTEVIADSVRTGGHEWPMKTSDRINNSEETWAFLKKFSIKDGETVVHPQMFSTTADVISAIYSSGSVHFQGIRDQSPVQVIDTKGRLVAKATVNQSQIALKDRSHGMYMLQIINGSKRETMRVAIY